LRRIMIATAALAVLAIAGTALASAPLNNYTAVVSVSGKGTPKKPVPASFTETLTATNANSAMLAAPLIDIKLTVQGMKVDTKPFPTCTMTQIDTAKTDTGCPKGSMVASGPITALLGGTNLAPPGTPCQPLLHVYNGGGGTIVFFFVDIPGHLCGSLQTGSTNAYDGTIKQVGNSIVQDTPLPPDVSTMVAGLTVYGSLIHYTLNWSKATMKVKGKTVAFVSSTGCKGSRKYSVAFTATDTTTPPTSATVTGKQHC
jgi:hypothetical protein